MLRKKGSRKHVALGDEPPVACRGATACLTLDAAMRTRQGFRLSHLVFVWLTLQAPSSNGLSEAVSRSPASQLDSEHPPRGQWLGRLVGMLLKLIQCKQTVVLIPASTSTTTFGSFVSKTLRINNITRQKATPQESLGRSVLSKRPNRSQISSENNQNTMSHFQTRRFPARPILQCSIPTTTSPSKQIVLDPGLGALDRGNSRSRSGGYRACLERYLGILEGLRWYRQGLY
ncbi:hypothetical protein B0T16DRAFT_17844 [Cercophora newfieldiana]|uniref:Uncharacterized protein n=1 Tax=Cercophora newfieldiana TaxID=92897 RepID=A0AA39YQZ7_9PEZI|nr:hypothetical protein B0T16DRAFT_17844 [Cercophora newfieldiana]